MKIAFIGGRNIHKLGGIETYMYHLCTELVKLGYEPIVFCESDFDGEEDLNGFKVIYQKSPKSGLAKKFTKPILGLRAMHRLVHSMPDVSVYHFNAAGPAYLGLYARSHNKSTIYQGHGLEWKRTKYGAVSRIMIRLIETIVVKCFTKYGTAVSDEQTDYWNNRGQHFVTIPCAVNLPEKIFPQSVMTKYNLEREGYFLSLGRLVQEKNPDYLIKAYISSGIKEKKLVIAGSNDSDLSYVKYLFSLASGNPNIIFTGAVYGDDKEALIQNCFAFCIPSTLEGLSITLLEAMSHSRVVIASDIPSNIEGLGKNGIWVKYEDVESLKDAILDVYNNPEKYSHIGQLNRKRVECNFTWEQSAKKYDNFISNIVNKQ